jgi:hypothetical protein
MRSYWHVRRKEVRHGTNPAWTGSEKRWRNMSWRIWALKGILSLGIIIATTVLITYVSV